MAEDKMVSVVFSFRNEEDVIPELVRRVQEALRSIPVQYELIFVNDVSTDRSFELLKELKASTEPGIKIMNMSRRCGVPECALAGMEYAKGDAIVLMDADLQDPPELIPEMVKKWQDGADVVYTVRESRAGESALKMWLTAQAYKVIRLISEIDLPENAGDFKLISRRALDELLKMKGEKEPYLRGMVTWTGFKQEPVVYKREARAGGQGHFPVFGSRGPVRTLLAGLTSFSTLPLNILLLIGASASALIFVLFVIMILASLFDRTVLTSWAPFMLMAIFSALQLLGLGILGIYVARVYKQVQGRPNYSIESLVGFED